MKKMQKPGQKLKSLNDWIKWLPVLAPLPNLLLLVCPAYHQQKGPPTWAWSCSRVRIWVSVKLPDDNLDCHNNVEPNWTKTKLKSNDDQNDECSSMSHPYDVGGIQTGMSEVEGCPCWGLWHNERGQWCHLTGMGSRVEHVWITARMTEGGRLNWVTDVRVVTSEQHVWGHRWKRWRWGSGTRTKYAHTLYTPLLIVS